MADVFDASPRPAIERLARIEGQSNFLSLLAGVEAGPDTTEDMGALACARLRGCVPEILEASIAQSTIYRLPLMSVVWRAVLAEFKPKEKDWPWIQGAIADAFLVVREGRCKAVEARAKKFKVDRHAYGAMRRTAWAVFAEMIYAATHEYLRARRSTRETTAYRHAVGGERALNQYGMAPGCYYAPPLPTDEAGDRAGFDTRGLGVTDRTTWDWRQEIRPSVVLTLHGAAAEAHCAAFPAWPASRTRKTVT